MAHSHVVLAGDERSMWEQVSFSQNSERWRFCAGKATVPPLVCSQPLESVSHKSFPSPWYFTHVNSFHARSGVNSEVLPRTSSAACHDFGATCLGQTARYVCDWLSRATHGCSKCPRRYGIVVEKRKFLTEEAHAHPLQSGRLQPLTTTDASCGRATILSRASFATCCKQSSTSGNALLKKAHDPSRGLHRTSQCTLLWNDLHNFKVPSMICDTDQAESTPHFSMIWGTQPQPRSPRQCHRTCAPGECP